MDEKDAEVVDIHDVSEVDELQDKLQNMGSRLENLRAAQEEAMPALKACIPKLRQHFDDWTWQFDDMYGIVRGQNIRIPLEAKIVVDSMSDPYEFYCSFEWPVMDMGYIDDIAGSEDPVEAVEDMLDEFEEYVRNSRGLFKTGVRYFDGTLLDKLKFWK